ncbi:MAG: hypothetical protein H7Y07_10670 [Pyrinomonadaceae bacterium]|nr:hypothetical protein [Sphingobacteriaceae bacterium]
MKIKFIIYFLISTALFSACDDKYEVVTDFSKPIAPYIEFSAATTVAAKEGVNSNVAVRLKESIQEPITVNYEITGAGAKTGSITIPRGALTANIVVNFPVGTVPASATTATSKITLKSAMAGNQSLTIGYAGTNQVSRNITISK